MIVVRPFIVMSASAKMPSSCWGRYRRIAVIETTDGIGPKVIMDRSRVVRQIVRTWERCHDGGARSAAALALQEAGALADRLNSLAWGCPI